MGYIYLPLVLSGCMALFGCGRSRDFPFREQFRCYSLFSKGQESIEHGGKIIMPSSALPKLLKSNVSYPMLFKIVNTRSRKEETHCGVLEFSAEEGRVYVPCWMMKQLHIGEGDIVLVENVRLKLATYCKFQPQTSNFLDIQDPKAVLERKLRTFACLTKNDIISVEYNGKIYELLVEDTEPQTAVSIIDCDLKVDFSAPVGYTPPDVSTSKASNDMDTKDEAEIKEVIKSFSAFSGEGQRIDGKPNKYNSSLPVSSFKNKKRGIPNYDYKKGRLHFVQAKSLVSRQPPQPMEDDQVDFKAFSGKGKSLRIPKQKRN